MTDRPFKDSLSLRLAFSLTLPHTSNSLAHSTKGTPSPCHSEERLSGLRLLVSTRFQVLFHSPLGVLFTFPSRYLCTIGHLGVFSLGGWSPQIPTGFLVSCSTRVVTNGVDTGFVYGAFTLYGLRFHAVPLPDRFVTPPHVDSHALVTPTTPHVATPVGLHIHGFRL